MDAKIIEEWIRNIGQTYDTLVSKGLISQPLQELYEGRDWLDIEPVTGLELSFWAETKRFERLFISLISAVDGVPPYRGELPRPLLPEMNQSQVRASFGTPLESKGIAKLPMNTVLGGFDAYKLDPATHPNMKISFQYTASLQVKTLVFSLIDRGHD